MVSARVRGGDGVARSGAVRASDGLAMVYVAVMWVWWSGCSGGSDKRGSSREGLSQNLVAVFFAALSVELCDGASYRDSRAVRAFVFGVLLPKESSF